MPTQIVPQNLFFAEKPSGVSTHRPSPDRPGFVEWLSETHQKELKVCHRLDKETSGAMVFATDGEAAQQLTDLFSSRKVHKEYFFVSPLKSEFETWWVGEHKAKGTLVEECPWPEEGDHFLSLTKFRRISAAGQFYLYSAHPITGKTHQIRKHATHSGIPLLGDSEYGGKKFPRLMLHCRELSFPWSGEQVQVSSPLPKLFQKPELCQDPQLSQWIVSIERRKVIFPEKFHNEECLRLLHNESSDLRADKVGDRVILGWWRNEKPTPQEEQKIVKLMEIFEIPNWVFQWRPGAQSDQSTELLLKSSDQVLQDWLFKENGVQYRGSLHRGQNFGLFLDQRDRRQWLKQNCENKSVLNLFAFTCGFSLNSAIGGASQVVSVDLFGKYLDWGKENFQLNGLDSLKPQYEWRKMDALEYLKYAVKKNLHFDFVVCDPPSFSRSPKSKSIFKIEKDFEILLDHCYQILNPQGVLLFSTNFEKWDLDRWSSEIERWCDRNKGVNVQISPSQWDYEFETKEANLKAFFIHKKS